MLVLVVYSVYSVFEISLSSTITSADPILDSTLPWKYVPIYCHIEKNNKIVILYEKAFFIRIPVQRGFLENNHEVSNARFLQQIWIAGPYTDEALTAVAVA